MSDIELDYDGLMQEALRRVVYDVLNITAELGTTPGDHHFYIEFLTTAPGVNIPAHLRETYPTRMTIVLHHQFKDLEVTSEGFSVSLWFKEIEARLVIPFAAMTSFADPGAKFGLRFQEDIDPTMMPHEAATNSPPKDGDNPQSGGDVSDGDEKPADSDGSADVVSLDAFRRK